MCTIKGGRCVFEALVSSRGAWHLQPSAASPGASPARPGSSCNSILARTPQSIPGHFAWPVGNAERTAYSRHRGSETPQWLLTRSGGTLPSWFNHWQLLLPKPPESIVCSATHLDKEGLEHSNACVGAFHTCFTVHAPTCHCAQARTKQSASVCTCTGRRCVAYASPPDRVLCDPF